MAKETRMKVLDNLARQRAQHARKKRNLAIATGRIQLKNEFASFKPAKKCPVGTP